MNAKFYLFDVDHGQCAALHLPNGRWCLFDAGGTASFSPVQWVVGKATQGDGSPLSQSLAKRSFKFLLTFE